MDTKLTAHRTLDNNIYGCQDSSSGSESESSHGSYHPGEAGHLAREGHLSGGTCRAAGIRYSFLNYRFIFKKSSLQDEQG